MVIRPLEESDSPYLFQWRNDPSAYRWFRDARPLGNEEHVQWIAQRVRAEPVSMWVACLGREPTGCARLDPDENGQAEVSVVVDGRYRGRGIGRLLLEHCATAAADRGIRLLRAEIRTDNAASIALFESAGYAGHRSLPGDFIEVSRALK